MDNPKKPHNSGHTFSPIGQYPDFSAQVVARLRNGAREYGNLSFQEPPLNLIKEVQEELLDVCAWGYILWKRLDAIRVAISNSEMQRLERDWCEFTEGD